MSCVTNQKQSVKANRVTLAFLRQGCSGVGCALRGLVSVCKEKRLSQTLAWMEIYAGALAKLYPRSDLNSYARTIFHLVPNRKKGASTIGLRQQLGQAGALLGCRLTR
jgi:hypothetical protein